MKTVIALAASLAVNMAVLGTLEWSAYQAQTPPNGVVIVTEAVAEPDLLASNPAAAPVLFADEIPAEPDLLAYKRGRAAQLLL